MKEDQKRKNFGFTFFLRPTKGNIILNFWDNTASPHTSAVKMFFPINVEDILRTIGGQFCGAIHVL